MNREPIDSSNSRNEERRAIEALMDEILADSFPASDPPTWGTPADRVHHLEDRERGHTNSLGDDR
jgi:hypothetical protein